MTTQPGPAGRERSDMSELSEGDREALDVARRLDHQRGWSGSWPLMTSQLEAVEAIVARHRAEAAREALLSAADAWTQGAWADTPRRADRVADRMAASQFAGDWLRDRAAQIGSEA